MLEYVLDGYALVVNQLHDPGILPGSASQRPVKFILET